MEAFLYFEGTCNREVEQHCASNVNVTLGAINQQCSDLEALNGVTNRSLHTLAAE
jgi:hypothetical protein